MRYDKEIFFRLHGKPTYNKKTGDYDNPQIRETPVLASIMDTKEETKRLYYDGPKEGSLTIHIQNCYPDEFDDIRVGKKIYRVDGVRRFRTKQAFIVSEVQSGAEV